MNLLKTTGFPLLIMLAFVFSAITFQSCNPDDCEDTEETCDTCMVVYKPNIYIYPEQELFLNITLDFPKGGGVVASIPEYGNGWEVTVDTAGKIDNKYDYLFYESEQPDVWQMNKGWCIKTENLTNFFTQNLSEYGFKGREINDFNEYWIPRFQNSDYYIFYPQTNELIDSVIELSFSEKPDNILRLFYVVHESDEDISEDLLQPSINPFSRDGFFVTEWGVIL